MPLHVVLVEPEIPQNTGNIARTCLATGSILHLVRPLGFSTEDKYLKRAGMDYWREIAPLYHDNIDEFLKIMGEHHHYLVTKHAETHHTEVSYHENTYILFGRETEGLPKDLISRKWDRCIRIPMKKGIRSLNLSSAAAVVIYEALRQQQFPGLR